MLGHPHDSLRADDARRPSFRIFVEFVEVEGLATLVDEGLDVVLEDLGVVMFLGMFHRIHPGGGVVRLLKIEAVRVEKLAHGNVAARRLHDDRFFLQTVNDCLQLAHLLGRYLVGLVQNERRAELDLLDEQAFDIVFVDILLQKIASAIELVVHARAVHDSDDVVQIERSVALVFRLVAEVGDDIRDGDGLTDARCLDDDVVVLARVRDVGQLVGQIIGKRAAQTAVRERDKVAVHFGEPVRVDECCIDVHLADVVHDDRGTDALLICEDVVQQRRLACAEIPGEQDNFDRLFFFHETLLCS